MKVEEAKQKWCPMVRAINYSGDGGRNTKHDDRNPEFARCIGPGCMMWTGDDEGECGLIFQGSIQA